MVSTVTHLRCLPAHISPEIWGPGRAPAPDVGEQRGCVSRGAELALLLSLARGFLKLLVSADGGQADEAYLMRTTAAADVDTQAELAEWASKPNIRVLCLFLMNWNSLILGQHPCVVR